MMEYGLRPHHPQRAEVMRILQEQTEKICSQLQKPVKDIDETVHDCRKRLKKMRALVRLVRKSVPEDFYKNTNRFYRDLGREMAPLRDCRVMLNQWEELWAKNLRRDAIIKQNEELLYTRYHAALEDIGNQTFLSSIAERLRSFHREFAVPDIPEVSFDAFYGGMKKVYKRGRKALDRSRREPATENLHDWRKRVKYLRYHLRLLKKYGEEITDGHRAALHRLSDDLGDDDLAEMRALLVSDSESGQNIIAHIDRNRKELQKSAFLNGSKIYMEKPFLFMQRMQFYYDAVADPKQ